MATDPKQPIPQPPPDVVPNPARPSTPQETPKPDPPIGVPQPGPDVVPAPEPQEIPATLLPELPPEAPAVASK
jgi:hypothetical protein